MSSKIILVVVLIDNFSAEQIGNVDDDRTCVVPIFHFDQQVLPSNGNLLSNHLNFTDVNDFHQLFINLFQRMFVSFCHNRHSCDGSFFCFRRGYARNIVIAAGKEPADTQ